MIATVNENCISCGICPSLAPDVFFMNDDGIAEAKPGNVPANLEDAVREAAGECPAEAIVLS